MAIKLDFEVNDELTYCDKTTRTADIQKIPYPIFLYMLFGGIAVTLMFGFGTFMMSLVFIFGCRRLLKKKRLRLRTLPFYLEERRSMTRRALSERRFRIVKQEVD